MPDLAAAWRLLHALPAAKTAIQRGIGISAGATAMGSLLMIPGVRGNLGSGTVNVGAAAGLLSGYLLARGILNAETPRPAPCTNGMRCRSSRSAGCCPHPILTPPSAAVSAAQPNESPLQAIWQFLKAVRAELSDPLTPVMALGSAASAILGSPVDAVLVGTVLTGNSMLAAASGFGPKIG